jgi:hypothetical protein
VETDRRHCSLRQSWASDPKNVRPVWKTGHSSVAARKLARRPTGPAESRTRRARTARRGRAEAVPDGSLERVEKRAQRGRVAERLRARHPEAVAEGDPEQAVDDGACLIASAWAHRIGQMLDLHAVRRSMALARGASSCSSFRVNGSFEALSSKCCRRFWIR